MSKLSMHPDEWMRWIYDPSHPDYHSARAKDLRARRAAALYSLPQWMKDAALADDERSALTVRGSQP